MVPPVTKQLGFIGQTMQASYDAINLYTNEPINAADLVKNVNGVLKSNLFLMTITITIVMRKQFLNFVNLCDSLL